MIKALRQINALEWIRGGSADSLYFTSFHRGYLLITALMPLNVQLS